MRNLVLSSLIIALLYGCSLSISNRYKKIEKRKLHTNEIKPIFNQDTSSYLFKAEIRLYKNYFSGLLVIKHIDSTSTRVVFITEMGLKIFDFEFCKVTKDNRDGFIAHYCMEAINKKTILSLLKKDFGLITMHNLCTSENVIELKDKKTSIKILKTKVNCRNNYLFFSPKTNTISKIIQSNARTIYAVS